jgi:hypothetical protein
MSITCTIYLLLYLNDMSNFYIWVVYKNQTDYPNGYIARKFIVDYPTSETVVGKTLEDVRSQLPPFLTRSDRMPGDKLSIVETWF